MKFYQVDAFADQVFKGNPAAIVPLASWIDDDLMQHIAEENNLSETAFFVKEEDRYHIRWFTPEEEVDLCGHATLAAAFIIKEYIDKDASEILFDSRSGPLSVSTEGDLLILDFPTDKLTQPEIPSELLPSLDLNEQQVEIYKGRDDYMVVIASESMLKTIQPDLGLLNKVMARGVIVTAPGDDVDFVSRCFYPRCAIPEDPVTGSAHTTMIPFWADRLGKVKLAARQISPRSGDLQCEYHGARVSIGGKAVLYAEGIMCI